jgi:hypothetical protein
MRRRIRKICEPSCIAEGTATTELSEHENSARKRERCREMLASLEAEHGLIDPEHVAVDSVRYHTAHHASWICLDTVNRHLLENETILSHPDLYRLADQAHEVLFQLYQRFGEKLVSPETPEV